MSFDSYEPIYAFHRTFFPGHGATPLVPLTGLAEELGVKAVYLKDEATRFGLSAFKVLGASWGVVSALARRYGLDPADVEGVSAAARKEGVRVYAATDGNHGRATAHTARKLGIRCTIYVPRTVEPWSIGTIRSEGAEVVQLEKNYDGTVQHAWDEAERTGGVLVQDTAWDGYEQIPMDIVEGYTHLFAELSTQLPPNLSPTHVIIPVGVGSLALAGALAYRGTSTQILTVEPDTAACLASSLKAGTNRPIITGKTIMPGLNCGTVSSQAWPVLKECMRPEHATTIRDEDAREAVEELKRWGVDAGPCGAAPMAGLRRFAGVSEDERVLGPESVVMLICTEGRQ